MHGSSHFSIPLQHAVVSDDNMSKRDNSTIAFCSYIDKHTPWQHRRGAHLPFIGLDPIGG